MSARKVAFLVTGLATGGAETMLLKLCSRLNRQRFVPCVISLSDKGAIGPRIEALGVPVYALDINPRRPSPVALLRLRRLLDELRPDLLQGWMYHGNLAASMAAGGRPVVWGVRQSLYGLDGERRITRWVIRLGAYISSRSDVIVYNSATSAHQHEAFGFDASLTRIIPNGFDADVFRPDAAAAVSVRRELGLSEEAILIGLICRYHPMKDHQNFLAAAALLRDQGSEAYFLLAGAAADTGNAALRAMIVQLGLIDRAFLLGERTDMPRLNAALDIACSASAWGEGFANAIGEAMSCGVPCVVTDIGDSGRIVGDTGKVVASRDAAALVSAWQSLLSLGRVGRQKLGMRARVRVIEEFSLEAVVKQYEDLYDSLISSGRA